MKYWESLKNNKILIVVFVAVLIATFLHLFNTNFPPLNSDEASFAYNAYSISQTGRDEYGSVMPSRFLAFGENKLPVTIYSIVPFINFFGLSEISSRLLFILMGILSPIIFYVLLLKITKNKYIAATSSVLAGISPWIQIMSRHIHENIIMLFLTVILFIYLIKLIDRFSWKNIIVISIINGLALFTYHIGKVMVVYTFIVLILFLFNQKRKNFHQYLIIFLIFFSPLLLFLFSELSHPTTRVANLLFFSDQGFTSKIEEERKEHDERVLHNKVISSVKLVSNQYLSYFSPNFLVENGDNNVRFGYKGISPISPLEYLLVFVGIYIFFKDRNPYRYLILSLLFVAPIPAALSWQRDSLTRSFLMIIPIIVFSSTGAVYLYQSASNRFLKIVTAILIIAGIGLFNFLSWEYYFYHYPKKPEVQSAWQAGYKELNEYIVKNDDKFDHYYITRKLGQPYIFTLFYSKYPPSKYQKEARLSPLDEYGFGQVEKFGKYVFDFQIASKPRSATIGTPDDFTGTFVKENMVKKIKVNGIDIFWIYTPNELKTK